MKQAILSVYTFLFIVFFSFSQNPYKGSEFTNQFNVFGKIIDSESGEPLEYATVTILKVEENSVVTGGITDKDGIFNIPTSKGDYNILIEYISFKNYTINNLSVNENKDLGLISLIMDVEALDAVEIIAEETTVEIKLDKKIYTVGQDLTVKGGNAGDVLDNIPSVSVDLEGNILLRGNDAARILINGKPSSLVGIDSKFLQQLPSDAIEKVEVITSPSARYEAQGSGGIINIILRKNKKLGLNGSISSNIGYPERTGLSSNLNYRNGKINFFNSSGFSDRFSPGSGYNYSEYYNGDQPSTFFEENRETERDRNSFFTNNGVEWYINDMTSVVGSFFYNQSESDDSQTNNLDELDSTGNILNQTVQVENEKEIDFNREYNLNFERNFNDSGHKLTIDLQYDNSKEWEDAIISENDILEELIESNQESESYLIQGDYVNPIGENRQFEAGFRISQDDDITDYRVYDYENFIPVEDLNQSNLFQYKERISALYTQYGVKVEDKYSFLVGLRLENTNKDINQLTIEDFTNKNETGLFPTFNFGLEISEDETLTFGYNRRIRRPWSRFINPFPTKVSPINIFRGNPNLDPTYSNNIDFGYLKRYESSFTINTSAYYQKSTNTFNFISEQTGETAEINGVDVPITERYPINLSTNTRFGFELNLSYRKGRKWNISSNFNVYSNKVEGSYNDIVYDNENVSWSYRLNNKLTLPGKIEWQTRMNLRGPSETAVSKSEGDVSIDLAFSKELFKDKASLTLNISDLLDQRGWRTETFNDTFYNNSEWRWRRRSFTLNFTYRFNQKKNQNRNQQRQSYDDGSFEF
ncbi:MAG: TonB-dependent receptor [Flavobacteriales bacterium]|nr:MAG: TonB-dependent receptor [Flavobacteriales bacterium]